MTKTSVKLEATELYKSRQTTASRSRTRKPLKQRESHRFLHLSFAFRIGLAMSFIAVCGALILVYLAVSQHWRLAQEQSDAFGQAIVDQWAISLVEPVFTDDYLAIQLSINQLASKKILNAAAVYNANGALIASSNSTDRQGIAIPHLLAGVHASGFKQALNSLPPGYYYSPVIFSNATAAFTIVAIDRSPLRASFSASSKDLIIAVIVISILSALGAYLFSRILSRPVYRLLEISEAAKQGRLGSIASLARNSSMRNEWADILSIYERLGDEIQNKREVEKLLGQFVASDVAEQLLSDGNQLWLDGESVEATVLFVDIVEFTRIAEPMNPDDVASMLNRYLSLFAACARIYRGTVDKFIGDAAMIVFGTPRKDVDHKLHAMACAVAIQSTARQINLRREAIGLDPMRLRIGVNSGNMRAGILGSEYRKEFTVVGDSVNLASRLCNLAAPGEILLSNLTYLGQEDQDIKVENAGEMSVKGKEQVVTIYRLVSAKTPQNWVVTNLIEDIISQH